MRHVVLHYHIFKNAGSTIDSILKKNFGEKWSSIESKKISGRLSAQDLILFALEDPKIKAISSHQALLPMPVDPAITFFPIIFLRHPIDRIGSIYSFERSQTKEKTKSQKIARERDMAGYIKWYLSAKASVVVSNFQTAFLSGATENFHNFKATSSDLRIAIQRLNELPYVGLVESFDESLAQMQNYLYEVFDKLDLNYIIENKSLDRKSTLQERLSDMENVLGAGLFYELLERNALDLELYGNAVKIFKDRVIASKEQVILEKEQVIIQQELALTKASHEKMIFHNALNEIVNSRAWRMVQAVQKFRRWLFPENSIHVKAVRNLNAINKVVVDKLKKTIHLLNKGFYFAQKNGLKETFLTIRFRKKQERPGIGLDIAARTSLRNILNRLNIQLASEDVLFSLIDFLGQEKASQTMSYVVDVEKFIFAENNRTTYPLIHASRLSVPVSRTRRRNILFITAEFPNYHHGGGNRVLNFIKALSVDNDIYLCTAFFAKEHEQLLPVLAPYCRKIFKIPYGRFGGNQEDIRNWLGGTTIDIVHYEWPRSLENYAADFGRTQIFTFMEAVSLRLLMDMERLVPLSTSWLEKLEQLAYALWLEFVQASKVDVRIAVTEKDAKFFGELYPFQEYGILNHGLNFDEFTLPDIAAEPNTLVFVGNYLHYPNAEAMEFFFNDIWENIRKEIPDVRIYIVGTNPTDDLLRKSDGEYIIVTGTVEDVRSYIQKASVCIAPLISGAGLRGKVIEYAALHRPFVATSIASTDLVFKDGVDYFCADTALEFSDKIIALLKDPQLSQKMANSAYETASRNYDNQRLTGFLLSLYEYLENRFHDE